MSYAPPQEPPQPPPDPGSGQAQLPKKKKRSGSEKRQLDAVLRVRCKKSDAAIIKENAAAVRLRVSGFLRMLGTGFQRPKERRPKLPELLPFKQAYSGLGVPCSNAAQLLRLANRGEYPDIEEVRDTHTKLNAAADALLAFIQSYSGDC